MKDFLQSTLASILGTLCAVFVLLFVVSTYFVQDLPPDIPESCVLVIDDTVFATERGSFGSLRSLVGDGDLPSLPLRQVVGAIDSAAKDGRIDAILLLNGSTLGSMAASRDVQEALLRFREKDKKVIAYAPDYDMSTYYLASVSDSVYMPPLGIFDMKGFAAELMFYADAMEKLGVEMQVTRVGKYKSAVEPFILPHASEANKEQVNTLLTSVQETWAADVGGARDMEAAELDSMIRNGGLFSAQEAHEQGLVDHIAYYDQMITDLITLVGTDEENYDTFAQVSLNRYLDDIADDDDGHSYRTRVAVVYAEGMIFDGFDDIDIGGDSLARELREVRLDPEIDAVVLRVNSPGGSATASEVILREMQLLREAEKPIIVSMGDLAASGGYWISCHADTIVAQPTTITGSIGVFGMFPNIEKLMDEVGVHVDTVATGPFSTWMSLYHQKTPEELAMMQSYVDVIYEGFLDRVASGRNMERDAVHEIAQGRVWSGADALELGLVDELGSLQDAIELAAEAANAEHYFVDYREPVADVIQEFTAGLLGYESQPVAEIPRLNAMQVPVVLQPLWNEMQRVGVILQKPGVYATLPYRLEIR
jgi:protease-4